MYKDRHTKKLSNKKLKGKYEIWVRKNVLQKDERTWEKTEEKEKLWEDPDRWKALVAR
jgi:hypothetical protein